MHCHHWREASLARRVIARSPAHPPAVGDKTLTPPASLVKRRDRQRERLSGMIDEPERVDSPNTTRQWRRSASPPSVTRTGN
jgi:hypothetical protein